MHIALMSHYKLNQLDSYASTSMSCNSTTDLVGKASTDQLWDYRQADCGDILGNLWLLDSNVVY